MNMMIKAASFMAAAVIILTGCGKSDNSSGNSGLGLLLLSSLSSGSDTVADMSQSSLDTVNDSMADINMSGETSLSYRVPFPGTWRENPTMEERIIAAEGNMTSPLHLRAATTSCPGGGSIDVTDLADTWNSSSSAFYITRTFSDCTGPHGFFKVGGSALLYWSGMNGGATGKAKLQVGSRLEQAPVSKRFTRVSTGDYVTVEGNGGQLSAGDLSGTIAHTVDWTAVSSTSRSFEVSTNLTRRGYNSEGTLIFEHRVTTPSRLAITADTANSTRTVSGTVQVEHVRKGVIVQTTFSSVVIPMENCTPSSGTATIAISGNWEGGGTINYNSDGTANYEYSYTNRRGKTRTGEGTFAVSGCQ